MTVLEYSKTAMSAVGGEQGVDPTHGYPVTQGYGGADSVEQTAITAAPAAAGTLAYIANTRLGAGTYEVLVTILYTGTVGAAEANNVALYHGATPVMQFPVAPVANAPVSFRIPRLTILAADAINCAAVGAATAGSSYVTNIIATPVA